MTPDLFTSKLRELAQIPVRFWFVAVVSGLLLYLGGATTDLALNNWDESVAYFFAALATLAGLLLALAPVVALVWPRTGVLLLLPTAILAAFAGGGWPWVLFPALVAVAVSLVWQHPRLAWLPAGLASVLAVGVILGAGRFMLPYGGRVEFFYNRDLAYLTLTSLMYVGAVVLAMGAAHWMRLAARRAGELAVLEVQRRELVTDSAALSERSRLAHDLHDVVAHHVSLIAVRAETAPYTQPGMGPEARGVLSEIAGDARLALDELRGVLGILNRAQDETTDRSPQPGLADVPALVERSRAAGAEVDLVGRVDPAAAPGVGYVAYRVVQEALTNARRHAPGHRVTVTLESTTGGLMVSVTNPTDPEATAGVPGRGLVGMRERVEGLRGQLVIDTAADTFSVRATMPRTGG